MPWIAYVEQEVKPLLQASRLPEALLKLQAYHAHNPQEINCLLSLGTLYSLSTLPNRSVHSLHFFRLAQELDRESAAAFYGEGELHRQFNRPDEAVQNYKRALFIQPDNDQYYKAVLSCSNKSLERLKENPPDIIFYTGHPDVAEYAFPHELDQKPLGGSESVLFLMAKALHSLGKRVAIFAPFPHGATSDGIDCFDTTDFFVYSRTVKTLPICIVSRYSQPFLHSFHAKQRILWLHDRASAACHDLYGKMDPQIDEYWMLTDYQKGTYLKHCPISEKKIWMTTNPIDPDLFPVRLPLKERIRNRLIYCSRPDRGIDIAIRVYGTLKNEFPDLNLTLSTYSTFRNPEADPQIRPFISLIKDSGLTLQYFGKKELAESIRQSHVMIYPNTAEGGENCCLASLETQGAGTPIVTADNGGMKETVENGITGFVFPWDGNKEILAQRMIDQTRTLLLDDSLWETFSSAAYESVWKKHHTEVIARQWLEHLKLHLD